MFTRPNDRNTKVLSKRTKGEHPERQIRVATAGQDMGDNKTDTSAEKSNGSLRYTGTGPLKILITGGNEAEGNKEERVCQVLDNIHNGRGIQEMHCGSSPGVESWAFGWAIKNRVKVCVYPIDWGKIKQRAWEPRNYRMLREALPDVVVVFPGKAKVFHMIKIADQAGIEVIDDVV